MLARTKSPAFQDDIAAELKLKPELRDQRDRAAYEKRETTDPVTKSRYRNLECYSAFFAEREGSSKTVPPDCQLKKCTAGLKLQHLGLILLYYVMPDCLFPLCV